MNNDERAEKVVDFFVEEAERMNSLAIGNIVPFIRDALNEKDEEIEKLTDALTQIAEVNFDHGHHKLACYCKQCWTWARATKELDCDSFFDAKLQALAGGEE